VNGEVILRTQDEIERSNVGLGVAAPVPRPTVARRAFAWVISDGWPYAVYFASRLILLLVALVDIVLTHRSLGEELSLYDGRWYLKLVQDGYPHQAPTTKSTLGFMPLYPLVIRGLSVITRSPLAAGLIIALAGGLITAVLVQRLATLWWGEDTARKAVLVFCLFPGAIVFSMAYSECLTLPIVLGCLLALRSGRWVSAGLLAGLAGTVEPTALVLIPVCLWVSLRYVADRGWRDREALRSLAAPVLAPLGAGAFAIYLWVTTGTPLASYRAQSDGWHQGGPIALLTEPEARRLLDHPTSVFGHLLNLSLWNGLLGSAFFFFALVALIRVRHELSPGIMIWTCGIGAITLWSAMSLTNARMLLIGFPAVIVWARTLTNRQFPVFLGAETALLVLTSALTYSAHMLP
jgi:Mannosyltransferase (PIG-V)